MNTIKGIVVKKDDNEDEIVLSCPNCGYKAKASIEQLQLFKREIRVKCKCSTVFKVKLEFRREFRKDANLEGFYYNPLDLDSRSERSGGVDNTQQMKSNCIIKDISMHGIGFEVFGRHFIEIGKRFRIRFKLGASIYHEIQKDVVVRFVKGSFIGCEFLETEQYQDKIGFYMM